MPADAKVQFNVHLPPELVRRVKHRAVDEGRSLSAFVEASLEAALGSPAATPTSTSLEEPRP